MTPHKATVSALRAQPRFPCGIARSPRLALVAVGLACAAFPLLTHQQYPLFIATQLGIYLLVALGLNVVTGYAGIPSLGHGAFVAIGAYSTAILTVDHGFGFWIAALAGGMACAVAGFALALPALRVSTWYFALISLAFAQVTSDLLVEWEFLTHGYNGIVGVPPPVIGSASLTPAQLFWLVAAINIIVFLMIRRLVSGRFGRALVAIRDNEEAAIACGVSASYLRLAAFTFSATIAGLAGALFAVQKTVITPEDFPPEFSIFFLVVVILGGAGRLYGPILGSFVFFALPEMLGALQSWRMLIYGGILLVLIVFSPHGLQGLWDRLFARLARHPSRTDDSSEDNSSSAAPFRRASVQGASVSITNLRKRFGGVVAVDDVSINVPPGEVHAIVGPNGSGKTTLLNLISGYYRPDAGDILIGGLRINDVGATRIARQGLARTFQTPKLLSELSTLDNAKLGSYATERTGFLSTIFGFRQARDEEAASEFSALEALDFVHLRSRSRDLAGDLPHGQQRLVEIARAMSGRPKLLLLDEPAAGLSVEELERLASVIAAIRDLGITVIIVEHRLELVADVCTRVTVLERGRVLASGTPRDVFELPEVVAAYMGQRSTESTSPVAIS